MLRQIVGAFKLWFHTSTSGHNVSLDKVARLLEDLLVLTEDLLVLTDDLLVLTSPNGVEQSIWSSIHTSV